MADNVTTPVPAGTALATKDVAGVQYPRTLIADEAGSDAVGAVGAAPAANTILGRLKAIADALLGTIGVSVSSLPLPAGAATSAKQDAIVAAIGGATYYPVTQPVSGTFWQTTQPVSLEAVPLPSGAATEATLGAISGKLPASLGSKAAAASFSITPASDATFPISAGSLPLPTGAATAAKQDAATAAIEATSLAGLVPFPITPGSSALARPIVMLSIATGGDVVFTPVGGGGDVTVTLPAGSHPLPATHIKSGTTAEGLTGW